MKTLIVEKGGTYESINMLELPHNEVLNLRAWARAARQMSMPIVKTPDGTFITNDDMIKLLTEE